MALPLKADTGATSPTALRAPAVTHPAHDLQANARQSNLGSPEGKKLIVGRETELKGNRSACDKLVVEGRVEAELKDCGQIEIAASGTFKGSADIEIADISGGFEGTLTAREIRIIRSTGRINGSVRFGKLEVERGGEMVSVTAQLAPEASDGSHRKCSADYLQLHSAPPCLPVSTKPPHRSD